MLGVDFRPLGLGDRPRLGPLLAGHPQPLSGYTFAALAAWDPVFSYAWAELDGVVLLSCALPPHPERHLLQPVGPLGPRGERALIDCARGLGRPLRIHGVSAPFLVAHPALAAAATVDDSRDAANYVYAVSDLADLAGRAFQPKRNHAARAWREADLAVADLGPEHLASCHRLAHDLVADHGELATPSLLWEARACERALSVADAVGLSGTVVLAAGEVVAFSLWEPLGPDTAVVHFERASRSIRGLYQVVNQEAARAMRARGFTWVNREEDIGDEGLRRAKLSYHPARLEKSYTLTLA